MKPFTLTISAGNEDLLYSVYNIYFSEIVFVTGFDILDIGGNMNRHLFAPRATTQEDMNNNMKGKEVDFADKYTVRVLFF